MPGNPYGKEPWSGAVLRVPSSSTDYTEGGGSGNASISGTAVATTVSVGQLLQEDVIDDPISTSFSFYSLTNAAGDMLRPGVAYGGSVTMPFRGAVVAISFDASLACSGTYVVYIGGVVTGGAIAVSAGTSKYVQIIEGGVSFSEGQRLKVVASGVASSSVVEVTVHVVLNRNSVF